MLDVIRCDPVSHLFVKVAEIGRNRYVASTALVKQSLARDFHKVFLSLRAETLMEVFQAAVEVSKFPQQD